MLRRRLGQLIICIVVVVAITCAFAWFIMTSNSPIRVNTRDSNSIGIPGISRNVKDDLTAKKDPWDSIPRLELFLRMFHERYDVYEKIFQPSLLLFWPQHIRVKVILDKESKKDHQLAKVIRGNPPYPKVYFEKPRPNIYNNRGHIRQQWSMFYPENYTKAEYVGYVDTDTLFVTVVTPEDLFRDGKPVIIGVVGELLDSFWTSVTRKNSELFKANEVMKCMSYFPVVFKVKHIIECRHYLEKLHNESFDAIIQRTTTDGIYSQFSIMCQCLYTNHRNDYTWRLQVRPNGDFNGDSPGRVPFKFYEENFTPIERSPITRTTIHWKYQAVPENELLKHPYNRETYYPQALLQGLCYSGGFEMCPRYCRFFNSSTIQRDLFNFEFSDWTWHPGCAEAQKKHYGDVTRLLTFYKSQGRPIFGEKNATIACERVFRMLKLDAKYQNMKLPDE